MFFFLYILNVFFCVFAHYLVFLFATRLCFSAKEEIDFYVYYRVDMMILVSLLKAYFYYS